MSNGTHADVFGGAHETELEALLHSWSDPKVRESKTADEFATEFLAGEDGDSAIAAGHSCEEIETAARERWMSAH